MRLDKLDKAVKHFEKWLAAMTPHDQMNFTTLVNLPNADKVVENLPEGEYRDMAVFALAIIKLRDGE